MWKTFFCSEGGRGEERGRGEEGGGGGGRRRSWTSRSAFSLSASPPTDGPNDNSPSLPPSFPPSLPHLLRQRNSPLLLLSPSRHLRRSPPLSSLPRPPSGGSSFYGFVVRERKGGGEEVPDRASPSGKPLFSRRLVGRQLLRERTVVASARGRRRRTRRFPLRHFHERAGN